MSRLPPADKLPLAVRKDIRDNWESKKDDFEKKLSDVLGVPWTIEIEPKNIYPYAKEGDYGQTSTGSMLSSYVGEAASRLQQYIDEFGDDAKSEINKAASAHILTMDVDLEEKVSYCGCGVSSSKQLVILFAPKDLAVNIDDAFSRQNITRALQEAPSSGDGGLSYETRTDISKNYTPRIGAVISKINELLKKQYTIDPGFEDAYAKLSASKDATRDWEKSLGSFMFQYMQGLANSLEYQKFGSDDMLQEAFNEAAESGKIAFRIVEASQMKSSYCETVFEDGVLYVQASTNGYGSNIDYAAEKIVDQL